MWADNVASVTIGGNTNGYANIQDAVAAAMDATEATVTLLANIDLGGGYITFNKGDVTLDLNGKTLAAHGANDIFVDGCSLTITDNSEGKTGSVPANASSLNVESGSITIHAGTFSSQHGACLNIQQGVTAKIDGGRFYTTHEHTSNAIFTSVAALTSGYAYYITGTNTQIVPNEYGEIPAKDITVKKVEESPAGEDAVSVTINGTTTGYADFATALTAAEAAEAATIKLLKNVAISFTTFDQGNITLDLNGKIIQNPNGSAMSVQGASLTIIDTSEEQTGTVTFTYQYEGSTISAISGSLTIYAGTFESTKRAALWVGKAYGSDVMPNVKLYGGHFISPYYAIYTEDPNILPTGYAFYATGTETVLTVDEEGYVLGTDNNWAQDVTVKTVPNYVASVTIGETTTEYDDFADAVTAALNAESATIKMLGDVNVNEVYDYENDEYFTIDKGNITLDLNGFTISAPIINAAIKLEDGSLTIEDNSVSKTGKLLSENGFALNVTGGSITIHGGTFESKAGCAFRIDNSQSTVSSASVDGGIFISIANAVWTTGISALKNGYSYYNYETDKELGDKTDSPIFNEFGSTAKKIIVKPGTVKATLAIGSQPEKNYYDFKKAFDDALDAESATIKMLADVTISSTLVVNKEDCNVTLDLNGHTIHSVGPNTLNLSNGKLTIKDSSGDDSGTISTNASNALFVTGGTITIHGGTFSSYSNALIINSQSVTATIDGGIFKANYSAILNYSNKSILANGYAFCNSDGDELAENVYGGINDGNNQARNITVKPATVKATLTIGSETKEYINFNSAFNAALEADAAILKVMQDVDTYVGTAIENPWIVNRGNVTLDLNGHTMYASEGYSVIKVTGGTLTILDSNEDKLGKMTTTGGNTIYATGGSITIKDGTFTSEYGQPLLLNGSATASLVGGRFISVNKVEAVLSYVGSPLADGYSYYNATTGVKLTAIASTSVSENDVIVMKDAMEINGNGAFTCPVNFTPQSVTLNRNITKDGGKYSFIVPFDIPADKAATLGKFYKFEKYENETVYFAQETDVKANTAYFFEPIKNITSTDPITLYNAEIKATTSMADASNPSELGLYGTYKQIDAPVGAYGYASDSDAADKFVRAGEGSKVNAFRCYLWLGSDATSAKANAVFGFDEATGINATKADYLDLNAPMYNLRGQRITSPQKGEIYIMGGKKVIFK